MTISPSPVSHYSLSPSPFEDLAKCNHHKFWKSLTRGLARYLNCFKPTKKRSRDSSKVSCNKSANNNCNYYSEMNNEERAEKLKSAIVYCKDSTLQVNKEEKQNCDVETTNCEVAMCSVSSGGSDETRYSDMATSSVSSGGSDNKW